MKRLIFTLLVFLAAPLAAQAADSEGRFAIKGAGLGTCESFTKARAEKSNAYYVFGGWLDGYMTAVNQLTDDTFDMRPWESTELLLFLIDNHCKKNPKGNFFRIVNTIRVLLQDDRLRQASAVVEARVDDKMVRLYRETMRRVQTALTNRDRYQGAIDGSYGPMTRNAIEAFQADENIPVTGLPDQLTLLRLLRPRPKAE